MTRSNLVDMRVVLHAETDRAIRVSETGDAAKAVWLPKSQVEIDEASRKTDRRVTTIEITVPEWLAHERGLI